MLAKINSARVICLLFILLAFQSYKSQVAITAKYFGMTIHPFGDSYANLQPYKLDKNAHFVLNFGAIVGIEKFLKNPRFSVKAIQAGFSDCSAGLAGFSHLGFRSLVFEKKKHFYYLGIGPVFFYRNSWARFGSAYGGSEFFNTYHSRTLGTLQYKFFPIGIDMEYDYEINERNRLSVTVVPGLPMALIFSIGWKGIFGEIRETNAPMIYVPRK